MSLFQPSQIFTCNSCVWRKVIFNVSDVRVEGINRFGVSFSCGGDNVIYRPASVTERLKANLCTLVQRKHDV